MTKVGILGAGQLGRMMALAGYPLGFQFSFFDESPDVCAGQVGGLRIGRFDDAEALRRFGDSVDVMTLEWENVPLAAANLLADRLPFYPPPRALEVAQDRLVEKTTLNGLGIGTAPFAPVETQAELDAAIAQIGLPGILKTRRGGYDGRGQALVRTDAEAHEFLEETSQPLIYEGLVSFERELSIVAARSTTGEVACYPLVENHHRDGILRLTLAPAPNVSTALQARAEAMARELLRHLDYVGVLTTELFQVGDELLANEIAPRVHNSGHWGIDGAVTSQFENHVRAICGLPLGDTSATAPSAMVNLIGNHPPVEQLLAVPGAHVHLYGKSNRSKRKIGHVNLTPSTDEVLSRLQALVADYEDG